MKPLLAILLATTLFSCKKKIEEKVQESLLEKIITNGVWIVDRYLENAVDITPAFSNYEFRFNANGTVTGTLGAQVANGTWVANINQATITASFTNAPDPLPKLNGTWLITDPNVTYVKAAQIATGGTNTLELRKK